MKSKNKNKIKYPVLNLERIKAERVAKGYNQEEIAKILGFSTRKSYSMRESGAIDFGANEFSKVITFLGFSPQDMHIFFKIN